MEIIIIYPTITTPKIKVNLLINKMIKDENLENIYENNITKIIIYNKNDKKNNVFKRLKKSDKKNCPGIGLKETGETSIMNIILQCFVHIKKFLKFLNIILKLVKAIEQQNYIK